MEPFFTASEQPCVLRDRNCTERVRYGLDPGEESVTVRAAEDGKPSAAMTTSEWLGRAEQNERHPRPTRKAHAKWAPSVDTASGQLVRMREKRTWHGRSTRHLMDLAHDANQPRIGAPICWSDAAARSRPGNLIKGRAAGNSAVPPAYAAELHDARALCWLSGRKRDCSCAVQSGADIGNGRTNDWARGERGRRMKPPDLAVRVGNYFLLFTIACSSIHPVLASLAWRSR